MRTKNDRFDPGGGDINVARVVDAFRFGVAAGAAAVMTPGTELCRREDATALFESMNRGRAEARRRSR